MFWLVKSEPETYSWQKFVAEGGGVWDGVRNYQARNNLQKMRVGDWALFYHSNEGREVVGVAQVSKESYPDPTTDDKRWVVVEFVPIVPLAKPVSLEAIKQEKSLTHMKLVKQSRLSVMPVTKEEFSRILQLGGTKIPR